MKKIFVIIALALTLPFSVSAYSSPGKPAGFVNDFAGALSADARQSIEADLKAFEQKTTHEVVVATVKTIGDDTVENYANLLFREWGIGKKDVNNGVLFLVSVDDHQMRIEVGYGLEGALTDIGTKYIQDELVRPLFKAGNYDEGVKTAVAKIEAAIVGEKVVPDNYSAPTSSRTSGGNGQDVVTFIFFILFFILPWLGSILGRSKSWWLGGVIGGVIGVVAVVMSMTWLLIPGLIVVGLLFDYIVSKNYKAGSRSWWIGGGPWIGGSMGGDDSGGGGFGGFGGGSSGGGGSSSSW